MKKILMLTVLLFVSLSIFAFDGTTNYNQNKNDFGFGAGYGSYNLYNKNNVERKTIQGLSLVFFNEFSLKSNRDYTFFTSNNLLIPSSSTVSINGNDYQSLIDYESSKLSINDIRIFAFESEMGIHKYSSIKDALSFYYGGGLKFGLFDIGGKNKLDDSSYSSGLFSFGALVDFGLQYQITSDVSFNISGTANCDLLIFEYEKNQQTTLTSNYAFRNYVKAYFAYKFDNYGYLD